MSKLNIFNAEGIRLKAIEEFMIDNPQYDEYVYCGPAIRYTQVLLAIVCQKMGKKLYCYTAKMNYNNLPNILQKYNSVILKDEYSSLADANRDKKTGNNVLQWNDQHIEYMVKYLHKPNMQHCWISYTTGTMLKALLIANPQSTFSCVDNVSLLSVNDTDYPHDFKRIKSVAFLYWIKFDKNKYPTRVWYYAKTEGNNGDYVMIE